MPRPRNRRLAPPETSPARSQLNAELDQNRSPAPARPESGSQTPAAEPEGIDPARIEALVLESRRRIVEYIAACIAADMCRTSKNPGRDRPLC
jgi:hypothetical protein